MEMGPCVTTNPATTATLFTGLCMSSRGLRRGWPLSTGHGEVHLDV